MIEYADPTERAQRLAEMIGIEDKVWLQVGDCARIYPIADEGLARENEVKTSSVHFLRFELMPDMITAAHGGEPISAGIDHPAYRIKGGPIEEPVRQSLVADLAGTQVH